MCCGWRAWGCTSLARLLSFMVASVLVGHGARGRPDVIRLWQDELLVGENENDQSAHRD